ncbi:Serine phosphatase RsbU, regulator of sigma subunit [Vibrio chagasii]|nr:Serine phosphatase RsbU, regulator of sigma subunit [Vibrio chagasii]CAH6954471.1 Serine phosphatase RsbU, regulator of sigma subunit [Vibrio chagasii]CAH6998205.1 Serine phosphatase RsbU, regulator of sigma subunit [Vibrio chagasii]
MNNIQKFDELVAMLLAHLYENFPRRTEIDAFEFLGINYVHHSFLEDNEGYEEYANKCQEVDFFT